MIDIIIILTILELIYRIIRYIIVPVISILITLNRNIKVYEDAQRSKTQ
nr:MAG TPA: hypothetical protein [Bacteriophage sp.]DAS29307.1 MAG TPA: hypothetical protein [Caudoviricetes sp.]